MEQNGMTERQKEYTALMMVRSDILDLEGEIFGLEEKLRDLRCKAQVMKNEYYEKYPGDL